jgi:hypothetical protein
VLDPHNQKGENMNDTFLRKSLNCIIQNEPNTLKAYVAKEAIQRKKIKSFFVSLTKRGCISGIIGSLNSYQQTHQFFDQYYDEIEQLRIDNQKQTGEQIKIPYDLKTSLSWFAFEQTAQNLVQELDITLSDD